METSHTDYRYRYTRHSTPRVWIEHRPIHPIPARAGETPGEITLTATADTSGGAAVGTIEISYVDAVMDREPAPCGPSENPCVRTVPIAMPAGESVGFGSYSVRLTTTAGERVSTAAYFLQIGSAAPEPPGAPLNQAIPIRVPWDLGTLTDDAPKSVGA